MRVAVVVYPGSNADWDALHVLRDVVGVEAEYVFHREESLAGFDAVVIPGGFSYGDYLRCGAIARFSPISQSIVRFAEAGGPVLGICNGFQVLTELSLLPGALTRNQNLRFICKDVYLRTETDGIFTRSLAQGEVLRMPVAHAEGRYQCDAATLADLQAQDLIAFRYCSEQGAVDATTAENGSIDAIAGIYNPSRNVLGLMPHPERAAEAILGNADGLKLFSSLCQGEAN